jgi:hypothetical protein
MTTNKIIVSNKDAVFVQKFITQIGYVMQIFRDQIWNHHVRILFRVSCLLYYQNAVD